jgi:hypothetical protein
MPAMPVKSATVVLLLLALMACDSSRKAAQGNLTNAPALDLSKPEDNLAAFVKVRGSTDEGEEIFFYAAGTIYSFIPGERDMPLMGFEMYNVGKMKKVEGGYHLLTREVGFYKDLKTGQILEKWYNPWIKDTCEVIQVWNDPVNQKFMLKSERGIWGVPFQEHEDRITMYSDIFLHYPSPLKVAEFPENSASDTYEAAELFQFFFSEKDLNNPALKSIPVEVSWTRVGPYLPWMRMGRRPGHLVYQCRGYKVTGPNAWQKIPQQMRDYVLKHHPEFAHAPDTFETPNETSWTYFKKIKAQKK